jgi:hypothetical protein
VHFVLVERTRATTSTPESPDVPARNGFNGFLRALVGRRCEQSEAIHAAAERGIASSRSLSSGAHSRDPLAPRNDETTRFTPSSRTPCAARHEGTILRLV